MAANGSNSPVPENGVPSWNDNQWASAAGDNEQTVQATEEQPEDPTTQPAPDGNNSDAAEDIDEDSEYNPEYDPESVPMTAEYNPEITIAAPTSVPVVEERSASAASSRPLKRPKTAGGFIAESSDDEDDAPPPTIQNLKPVPGDAQASRTQSPARNSEIPQTIAAPTSGQTIGDAASAAPKESVAVPPTAKSRLPTDIVGTLEDRIQEDPKGDIDAWLALVDELQRRHQIEDARKVYERFVEVFPQSVSQRKLCLLPVSVLIE